MNIDVEKVLLFQDRVVRRSIKMYHFVRKRKNRFKLIHLLNTSLYVRRQSGIVDTFTRAYSRTLMRQQ